MQSVNLTNVVSKDPKLRKNENSVFNVSCVYLFRSNTNGIRFNGKLRFCVGT